MPRQLVRRPNRSEAPHRRAPALFRRLACEPLEERRLLAMGVSGLVWHDLNSNGIRDAGEPGIAGACAELFRSTDSTVGNADDVSVGTCITDANGAYAFSSLASGTNYYLTFRTPVGFAITTRDAGSNDSIDSDVDPATAQTAMFTLTTENNNLVLDAGSVGESPAFGFASRIGGTDLDYGSDIVVDRAGNVYVTGGFRNTVDFDPGLGTSNLTSNGNTDIFVAKYTSTGALAWVRAFGGSSEDMGTGLVLGTDGCVYAVGMFDATVDFDPGPNEFFLTAWETGPCFITKLNDSGNFVWARSFGQTKSMHITAGDVRPDGPRVALGSDGSFYMTGFFEGTADFDPGPGTFNLTSATTTTTGIPLGVPSDVFVLKLDRFGSFVWAKSCGGPMPDYGRNIALDANDSVYVSGTFSGTADFDPGPATFPLTSADNPEIFILKLDHDGNFTWAKNFDGENSPLCEDLAVDAEGAVYSTGRFYGVSDFDPGSGTFSLVSAGGSDAFVCKLDNSGNFVWAKRLGGANNDGGSGIAIGPEGGVYTTGYFKSTADFDPSDNMFPLDGNQGSVFISKLDGSGNFVTAQFLARSLDPLFGGVSYGLGLTVSASGTIYSVGTTRGTNDFDPGEGQFFLNSAGHFDAFISRILPSRPVNICLSTNTVAENLPAATVVGVFSTIESETDNAFTCSLAGGDGDVDNTSFLIEGNRLKTAASFDYETKNSYSIRVRTTDSGGLSFEKAFTLNVTDVDDFDRIAVGFGGSNGTWLWKAPGTWTPLHGLTPVWIVSGDLDANGIPDLVINFGGSTGIWIYHDTGAWQYLHPATSTTAAMADIDGDNRAELILTTSQAGIAGVWAYDATLNTWSGLAGWQAEGFAVGDFDGNGKQDVAVDFGAGKGIWFWNNNTAWQYVHNVNPGWMAAGDLDGNGKTDLALSATGTNAIWARLDSGAWQFIKSMANSTATAADANGDGRAELFVSITDPAYAGLWEYSMTGSSWKFTTNWRPENLTSADVDGNGKKDVVADFGTNGLWIYKNDATWQWVHSLNPQVMTGTQYGQAAPQAAMAASARGALLWAALEQMNDPADEWYLPTAKRKATIR